MTQVVKTDGCIDGSAEDASKDFVRSHNDILHAAFESRPKGLPGRIGASRKLYPTTSKNALAAWLKARRVG
jgi:hypothetical protein